MSELRYSQRSHLARDTIRDEMTWRDCVRWAELKALFKALFKVSDNALVITNG